MKVKKSNPDNPRDVHALNIYREVSPSWLIMMVAALIVVPLFGKAASRFESANHTGVVIGNTPTGKKSHTGKWGTLTLAPIVISPPLELVSTDLGAVRRPTWFFPGTNADKAVHMLQSAGISAADAARLRAEAQEEPRIEGVVFTPDPDWVRALTPDIRARVYAMLAKSDLNLDQVHAFRYPGARPETWLDPNLISTKTRQLVEPLIFRDGAYMMFSDLELVRSEIQSNDELRRLSKALFRQPTMIAQLSVDRGTDVDTLVDYWGRGGRDIKIRPLIESLAESDTHESIDVIHLLPPFAQEHLYRYPTFSSADLNKPAIVNCLWTSLNFFQPEPDDRFLDPTFAIKTFQEDYFIIESDFKLGDIVAFLNKDGNIYHAAVYIAGDIVFSKNGISSMAPWTLMSIEEVKEYYRWHSENPRIIVYRRKDL